MKKTALFMIFIIAFVAALSLGLVISLSIQVKSKFELLREFQIEEMIKIACLEEDQRVFVKSEDNMHRVVRRSKIQDEILKYLDLKVDYDIGIPPHFKLEGTYYLIKFGDSIIKFPFPEWVSYTDVNRQ